MEEVFLTILSVFAFLGLASIVLDLMRPPKTKYKDYGVKLVFYLPENSSSKIEGVIRDFYFGRIPEINDNVIYLIVHHDDAETMKIIEKLKNMYPIEVLSEQISCCMIKIEKNNEI